MASPCSTYPFYNTMFITTVVAVLKLMGIDRPLVDKLEVLQCIIFWTLYVTLIFSNKSCYLMLSDVIYFYSLQIFISFLKKLLIVHLACTLKMWLFLKQQRMDLKWPIWHSNVYVRLWMLSTKIKLNVRTPPRYVQHHK